MSAARFDVDLFGNERPASAGPRGPVVRLGLFEAASELAAIASGRPKSQERTELLAPAGFSCLCGDRLPKRGLLKPCAGCGQ